MRIFGTPDFVHIGWDVWARQEVVAGDTAIFARGTAAAPPSAHAYPDIRESDDDRRAE